MDYMSEEEDADYDNEPYGMKTDSPISGDGIAMALQPANLGYQQPQQSTENDEAELKLLRRFLEEAGLPPHIS